MSNETKICKYCGGEVLSTAKKCRHCGEWLVVQEKDKPKASIGCYGTLVFIALICGIFISGGNFDSGMPIFLGVLIGLCLYFVPTIIADNKRTSQTLIIFAVNLFLGITGIGWIGCLIWALILPDNSKNETDEDKSWKEDFENTWQEISKGLEKEKEEKQLKLDNMPKELQNKFNWGAFLWNWIWGIVYKRPITLLIIPVSIIPILGQIIAIGLMIWFGKEGNLWAWYAKEWKNVEEFNNSQKKWTISGIILYGIILILSSILIIAAIIISNVPENQQVKSKTMTSLEQCKEALGKKNLSDEDIIICNENLGINVYKDTKSNSKSDYSSCQLGDMIGQDVETIDYNGMSIDYHSDDFTEKQIKKLASECSKEGIKNQSEMNCCINLKMYP